jgi:hypothetical protein
VTPGLFTPAAASIQTPALVPTRISDKEWEPNVRPVVTQVRSQEQLVRWAAGHRARGRTPLLPSSQPR